MTRSSRDVDAARQRLVDHARETILADVDAADPYYEAFNRLAGHAGAFLDAPGGHDSTRPRRRKRATTATLVLTLVAGGVAVGAAGVVMATKTDLLTLTGITNPEPTRAPTPSPAPLVVAPYILGVSDLPVTPADGDAGAIIEQVLAELAAQRQAEADAAAAAAAQQAQSGGGSPGTSPSSGGTTGGTNNGGGGAAPPPAPAPAAYVSSISFRATTGTGVINISADIQTSGSMNVGVNCTANGTSISLSGPGTVNGPGSYTGSFSGLAAGTYNVSCAAGGVASSSTNLTVY